ncbi:uncharacterized protein LOC143463302 [Clavelina lepadiformis]|uniref:uncharacterized protein LOC143463302 n=1 Tax=Clavelina lepadiformis TaxID=159417 RepID=UPI004041D7C2
MKLAFLSVLIILKVSAILGCKELEAPSRGSKVCLDHIDGQQECYFACEDTCTLIGSEVLTCSGANGEWDGSPPFCQPDFTKCKSGKKCPKLSKEEFKLAKKYKNVTSEEEAILAEIDGLYFSYESSRGTFSRFRCMPQMCKIPCSYLRVRRLCNVCRSCKLKRKLKCGSQGSLFGR